MTRRISRVGVVLVAVALVVGSRVPAFAAWSAAGSGSAGAAATIMPTGTAPSGTAGVGSVTLSWTASNLDGSPVSGYLVRRYDSVSGSLETVAGSCSGTVTSTSCTDASVPAGTWVYTVTPVQNSWQGGESARSVPVSVG